MLLILGSLLLVGVAAFLGARLFFGAPAEAEPEISEADMTATEIVDDADAALDPNIPTSMVATAIPPSAGQATLTAAEATAQAGPLFVEVETPTPEVITITTVPKPPISVGSSSFANGILHGLISPITLILSLITPTIRAYDPENAGPLYDFGFVIGVVLMAIIMRWLIDWLGDRPGSRRKSAYSG
jgi:hypothetical protein